MNPGFTEFYRELEFSLPGSSGEQRRKWAAAIVEKDIAIKDLCGLLSCEHKVASRFLWLLTDIGLANPDKLFAALPFLFDLCNQLDSIDQKSFVSFWLVAGIPAEQEAKAIDLLFQWLRSNDTNVTTKSRAMLVLFKLTKKYPDLKNELRLSLADQADRYSNDFKKRVNKILELIST